MNLAEMEESMTASTVGLPTTAPMLDKPTAQLSLTQSHISLEDRTKLEEERERLYSMLDSKDDEIQEQSQLVEKLKEQMLEQEELISSTRRDYENLTKEMSKIQVFQDNRLIDGLVFSKKKFLQTENDSAKDEVKDVLQALEELAVNYDQKSQEVETKNREYNTISDELTQKQTQLNNISSELSALKDSSMHTKKRVNEMLRSLLTDLGEVGTVITKKDDLKKPDTNAEGGKIEEEFTVARLYVSKMKSEVKNLVHKATLLETAQNDGLSKVEGLEKDLSESKLLIGKKPRPCPVLSCCTTARELFVRIEAISSEAFDNNNRSTCTT